MADSISRRKFAGLVAAGTVLTASTEVTADDEKPAANLKPPSPVELMVELVREKYPDTRLDDAAIAEIHSDFRHYLGRSKVLSSFALKNGDEPGFVFSAWRADFPPK